MYQIDPSQPVPSGIIINEMRDTEQFEGSHLSCEPRDALVSRHSSVLKRHPPLQLTHLPLASWQGEWRKLLCTLTDSTCAASWAASLISPCPPITTFLSWKTPWMGKTSTRVEPSNASRSCPRDRAYYPEDPGHPETLPDATHRGVGTRCVSSHHGKTRTRMGVPVRPFLLTLCGPHPKESSA